MERNIWLMRHWRRPLLLWLLHQEDQGEHHHEQYPQKTEGVGVGKHGWLPLHHAKGCRLRAMQRRGSVRALADEELLQAGNGALPLQVAARDVGSQVMQVCLSVAHLDGGDGGNADAGTD